MTTVTTAAIALNYHDDNERGSRRICVSSPRYIFIYSNYLQLDYSYGHNDDSSHPTTTRTTTTPPEHPITLTTTTWGSTRRFLITSRPTAHTSMTMGARWRCPTYGPETSASLAPQYVFFKLFLTILNDCFLLDYMYDRRNCHLHHHTLINTRTKTNRGLETQMRLGSRCHASSC
jgi:hypothetical protein